MEDGTVGSQLQAFSVNEQGEVITRPLGPIVPDKTQESQGIASNKAFLSASRQIVKNAYQRVQRLSHIAKGSELVEVTDPETGLRSKIFRAANPEEFETEFNKILAEEIKTAEEQNLIPPGTTIQGLRAATGNLGAVEDNEDIPVALLDQQEYLQR